MMVLPRSWRVDSAWKEVNLKDRKTGERKSRRLLSVEGAGRLVLEDNDTHEIYMMAQEDWNVTYVIILEKTGWAEIENRSGVKFENPRIRLIAAGLS